MEQAEKKSKNLPPIRSSTDLHTTKKEGKEGRGRGGERENRDVIKGSPDPLAGERSKLDGWRRSDRRGGIARENRGSGGEPTLQTLYKKHLPFWKHQKIEKKRTGIGRDFAQEG